MRQCPKKAQIRIDKKAFFCQSIQYTTVRSCIPHSALSPTFCKKEALRREKMQIEPLPRNAAYRFDQPIRIVRYRPAGLDIMFYSALLGLSITAVFFLLCFHDGKIQFYFTFFRTLLSFPFVLLALLMQSLLKELRLYTKALLKRAHGHWRS